jgi:hypothetical protein
MTTTRRGRALATCPTIPGCDGYWHHDDTHVAPLSEAPLASGNLIAELVNDHAEGTYVTLYAYGSDLEGTAFHSSDPAELYARAAAFRQFADAIEDAADYFARQTGAQR